MQYSPYYDTYGAYITYIFNIDTYMVDSKFVIWKNSVKFVCENKTLTSCPDGAAQNLKTMDKKVLFKKWFDNYASKSATTKKVFSEFTISEKEDYLTSNFPELVPNASTKINAVTKLSASPNVPFDIIAKLARLSGKQDNEVFAWWAECIKKENTFDLEVSVEYGKASQKARVSYLQKVSGVSESKEVEVPILGGLTFFEFLDYSFGILQGLKERAEAEKAAEEESKETEVTE